MNTLALLIIAAALQSAVNSPVHQAVVHEASSPVVRLSGPVTTCDTARGFRPLLQGTGCVRSF